MDNVLLVAYLLIVLAMIAVILLQRSEGGGLGMGGGGNNGFMTARGSANVLTRTTAILAALFFVLAIGLTVIKTVEPGSSSILDSAAQGVDVETETEEATPDNMLDALNQLQEQTSGEGAATTDSSASTTTPVTDSPNLAVPETPASGETSGN